MKYFKSTPIISYIFLVLFFSCSPDVDVYEVISQEEPLLEQIKSVTNIASLQLPDNSIGEIGIDLYWDKTLLKQQQEAFRYQIVLAKRLKLPIVIHCRDAFDEIFEILETEKSEDLRGIFHCFTGTLEQAEKAISYNMKLGIGGVVTFKNGKIDKFLNKIGIEHIVLETDAPYLAPAPYRGKRNDPVYLLKVLEKLALVYEMTIEQIAEITTENSKNVFGV